MNESFLDSKFMRVINLLADLVNLSILWSLCSLPIMTIGWSTAALYHTVQKVLCDERGTLVKTYLNAMRQSAKYGLLFGALLITLTIGASLCAYSFGNSENGASSVPFIMATILLLLLIITQIYLYPLIGHFELNGSQLIFLSVHLTVRHPLKSLFLLAVWLGVFGIVECYPPLLMIAPAGFVFAASRVYTPLFFKYIHTVPNHDVDGSA